MPLKGKPSTDRVAELAKAVPGRERVQASGRELYLYYPDGVGRSRLTGALIDRNIGLAGTGRNWNTALKIMALLEA
jgi:uncharacterized protein (DUF1697 family)